MATASITPGEEEDQEMKHLLEKFSKKSEELQRREINLLKRVEVIQSAVASLLGWKHSVEPATSTEPPPMVDVKEIEAETNRVKEETERIRREVAQKIEENKELEERIRRRKGLYGDASAASVAESSPQQIQQPGGSKGIKTGERESGPLRESDSSGQTYDPGVEFFSRKLRQLEELEVHLKRELELESEKARKKREMMTEKIDRLERGSRVEMEIITKVLSKARVKK